MQKNFLAVENGHCISHTILYKPQRVIRTIQWPCNRQTQNVHLLLASFNSEALYVHCAGERGSHHRGSLRDEAADAAGAKSIERMTYYTVKHCGHHHRPAVQWIDLHRGREFGIPTRIPWQWEWTKCSSGIKLEWGMSVGNRRECVLTVVLRYSRKLEFRS